MTSNLEAIATRFLKKWVGLARPADPSRLYLLKTKGGLGLPAISTTYKKQQASLASLILTSPDPVVKHTVKQATMKEENLQRPIHKRMLRVRGIWQIDPGANRKSLLKRAKAQVSKFDSEARLEHARSLPHQGQLLRATEDKAAGIWSSAVLQLPPKVLSFSLNAAQDTLPHNANQALWRRRVGVSCVQAVWNAPDTASYTYLVVADKNRQRNYYSYIYITTKQQMTGILGLSSFGSVQICGIHK